MMPLRACGNPPARRPRKLVGGVPAVGAAARRDTGGRRHHFGLALRTRVQDGDVARERQAGRSQDAGVLRGINLGSLVCTDRAASFPVTSECMTSQLGRQEQK